MHKLLPSRLSLITSIALFSLGLGTTAHAELAHSSGSSTTLPPNIIAESETPLSAPAAAATQGLADSMKLKKPASAVSAPSSGQNSQAPSSDAGLFSLALHTDRAVYQRGERVRIIAQSNQNCRLTVIDIGSSGNVKILFPNRFQPDNLIRAGQSVMMPSLQSSVDYIADGPTGFDTVIGLCSTSNIPVYAETLNFQQNVFQPWGSADQVANELAAAYQNPTQSLAQATALFFIN